MFKLQKLFNWSFILVYAMSLKAYSMFNNQNNNEAAISNSSQSSVLSSTEREIIPSWLFSQHPTVETKEWPNSSEQPLEDDENNNAVDSLCINNPKEDTEEEKLAKLINMQNEEYCELMSIYNKQMDDFRASFDDQERKLIAEKRIIHSNLCAKLEEKRKNHREKIEELEKTRKQLSQEESEKMANALLDEEEKIHELFMQTQFFALELQANSLKYYFNTPIEIANKELCQNSHEVAKLYYEIFILQNKIKKLLRQPNYSQKEYNALNREIDLLNKQIDVMNNNAQKVQASLQLLQNTNHNQQNSSANSDNASNESKGADSPNTFCAKYQ